MNETIRALRREHDERLAKADELLSKATPLQCDIDEATEHLDRVKQIKARLALDEARGDGAPSATGLALKGAVHGGPSGFTNLGFTAAGKAVLDASTGQLLEDVGPGTFGRKLWDTISTPEYKRDFTKYIRNKGLVETKTLQEGLDDQGGVLVPADWLARIIARKPAPTSLAGLVTNLTTGRDRLVMPRVQYNADDLYVTNFRVTWTGEVPASDSQAYVNDAGLFGNVEIPIYTAMLNCTLTNDMVEDSAFPIQAWLEDQLRLTVELTKENMIINGTGKGQPTGFQQDPQPSRTGQSQYLQYITSSSSGTFTADDIRTLPFVIPPQYD
ncbi:MAG: phage major capsid protein, partial [Planctomycetaceae bacterium]|nr:phage major capsid protein [Planctomycetaceae bacterium]